MKKVFTANRIVVVILLFSLLAFVSFAWFVYFEEVDIEPYNAGEIDYQYAGSFIDSSEIIYPGLNLLSEPIAADNQSTINTQLRLKIDYTLIEASTTTKTYLNDASDDLSVVFDDTFINQGDYWYFQAVDYDIIPTGQINVISSISYDGNRSSVEYASQSVSVNVIIQVKQADNVEWVDLVSYDFETGNPI